jgi:Phospholipase_D-nuclease N-terminal
MRRRRWGALSGRQRGGIIVAGVVQASLSVATLVDLRRRPSTQIRGSKRLWTAAAFVNYVGPLAYVTFGRR